MLSYKLCRREGYHLPSLSTRQHTLKMTAWLRHVVRKGRSRNPGRQRATGDGEKGISLIVPRVHPKEAQKLSNI